MLVQLGLIKAIIVRG